MKFKQYLKEQKVPFLKKKQDRYGHDHYLMDVKTDRFIHFTPVSRINEISDSKKLLIDPPYKKFGIDAVTAVSAVYGEFVPEVQTTHSKGDMGAIFFSTRTVPKYGRVEEVIWDKDVDIILFKLLTVDQAVKIINNPLIKIDDQDMVHYSKDSFERI